MGYMVAPWRRTRRAGRSAREPPRNPRGLGASFRYHFLGLGRVVPYVELFGAAGTTDLKVLEINSDFTFLVHGGAGLSVFVTDRVALYAPYEHQSGHWARLVEKVSRVPAA